MTTFPPPSARCPRCSSARRRPLATGPSCSVGGTPRTFAEMRDAVARPAGSFAAAGVGAATASRSCAENRLELVDAWFALRLARRDPRPVQHGDARPAAAARARRLAARASSRVETELLRAPRRRRAPAARARADLAARREAATGRGADCPSSASRSPASAARRRAGAARATRSRSSTPRARPARRRASVPAGAVLLVGAQHGGDARRADARTTSSTPACRSSTRTR